MLARLTLLIVLLVSPWLYGGVHEPTQVWLVGGMLLALVLSLPVMLGRDQLKPVPPTMWLLLMAVGWAGLQVVPLPQRLASVLSPGAVALRAELQPDRASPDAALMDEFELPMDRSWQTLSLRPSASWQHLTWLVVATIAFLLGWQLFGCKPAVIWLWGAIGCNGAALALFGVIQQLTWNGQIYWTGIEARSAFASFANRNNAAGYICLCLAATLGFTAWTFARNREDLSRIHEDTFGRSRRSIGDWWVEQLAELDGLKLASLTVAVCLIGAVFCTLSRGGGVAMLAAACCTASVLVYSRRSTTPAAGILGALIAGVGLVAWVGVVDLWEARFQKLGNTEMLLGTGRIPNWRDALHAVPDYPLIGTGLNTYQDVYLMYEHRFAPGWYYFAENQYVQAVVEAGVVGLLLLVGAIALVARASLKLLSARPPVQDASHPLYQRQVALGQAGVFATASQAVHAVTDFGLYLPANLLLMAVLCGSVAGAAAELTTERHRERAGLAKWLPAAAAVVLATLAARGAVDFQRITAIRAAREETAFVQTPGGATEQQLTTGIAELSSLTSIRPADAELHYHLAKQWIHLYHLRHVEQLRQATPPETTLDELWELASPTALHQSAHHLARAGDRDGLTSLRAEPLVRDHLRPALKELLLARTACPILAKIHLRLARLSVLVGAPPADAVHLLRATRLEPADSYLRTRAGRLHAQAGRIEQACQDWRAILAIDPSQLEQILDWSSELTDATLVEKVLPAEPRLLLTLAENRFAAQEPMRGLLLERASEAVEQVELPAAERNYLKGRIALLRDRTDEAIDHYRRAVELDPLRAQWQYELATLLAEAGRVREAHEHARMSARLEPDNRDFDELLRRLIRELK